MIRAKKAALKEEEEQEKIQEKKRLDFLDILLGAVVSLRGFEEMGRSGARFRQTNEGL